MEWFLPAHWGAAGRGERQPELELRASFHEL